MTTISFFMLLDSFQKVFAKSNYSNETYRNKRQETTVEIF